MNLLKYRILRNPVNLWYLLYVDYCSKYLILTLCLLHKRYTSCDLEKCSDPQDAAYFSDLHSRPETTRPGIRN